MISVSQACRSPLSFAIKTFAIKSLSSLLCITAFFLSLSLSAQTRDTLFFEDFEAWNLPDPCLNAWSCSASASCTDVTRCQWARNDQFDIEHSPNETGCTSSTFYARCSSSQLSFGDIVSLTLSSQDLSSLTSDALVSLNFCYINPSTQNIDADGIRISFSRDGGANWETVFFDNNAYETWTQFEVEVGNSYFVEDFQIKVDGFGDNSSVDLGVDQLLLVHNICVPRYEPLVLSGDTVIACDPERLLLEAQALEPGQSGRWTSNTEVVFSPNAQSPQVEVSRLNIGTSTFKWTVFEDTCALAFDSVTVEVSSLNALITSLKTPTCVGQTDASVQVNVSGGTAPYTYVWNTGDNQAILEGLSAGSYSVMVIDQQSCMREDSITLDDPAALSILIDTMQLGVDGQVQASAQVSGGTAPYRYRWNTDLGDTTATVVLAPGSYLVHVQDANACTDSVGILIPNPAPCFKVHTGFSPNGDGINDQWFLPCVEEYPENEITILNRWGQPIQAFINYDNTWDGRIEGQALTDGTYFYILVMIEGRGRRTMKGTVTLIR